MGHRPRGIRFRPDRPQGSGKKRPIAGSVQRVAARQPEDTPGGSRQPETARLATISGSVIMTNRIDAHHRGPAPLNQKAFPRTTALQDRSFRENTAGPDSSHPGEARRMASLMASVRVRATLCSEPAAPSRRRRVIDLRFITRCGPTGSRRSSTVWRRTRRSAPQVCGG